MPSGGPSPGALACKAIPFPLWVRLQPDSFCLFVTPRSREQFTTFRAPAWAYVVPTEFQALGRLLPGDPYQPSGTHPAGFSYLGMVTLALMGVAALARPRLRHAGF